MRSQLSARIGRKWCFASTLKKLGAAPSFLCNRFDLDSRRFVEMLREQAANVVEPPISFDELGAARARRARARRRRSRARR
jgi:hypothetical protein